MQSSSRSSSISSSSCKVVLVVAVALVVAGVVVQVVAVLLVVLVLTPVVDLAAEVAEGVTAVVVERLSVPLGSVLKFLFQMGSESLLDIPWFAFDVPERGTPDRKHVKTLNTNSFITGKAMSCITGKAIICVAIVCCQLLVISERNVSI